jgi:hypothetical protein
MLEGELDSPNPMVKRVQKSAKEKQVQALFAKIDLNQDKKVKYLKKLH